MLRETVFGRTVSWVRLARLALLITGALVITNLGLSQAITGTLVNALLLLAVEYVGVNEAMVLGMVTPFSAALRGILPLSLWVMIPLIALGNATLVSVYGALRSERRAAALVVAAAAKVALLFGAVTLLVAYPLSLNVGNGPLAVKLPAALVQMMQWPQLATALAGGLVAQCVRLGVRCVVNGRTERQ